VINISEDIYAARCVLFFTFKFHHEFDGGSCAWLYLMLGTGLIKSLRKGNATKIYLDKTGRFSL
jgi:hypothetical protein